MALLREADVRRWVPQAEGRDELVGDAIALAEGLADQHCGRTLASTTHDDHHDIARGQRRLVLRHWPVISIEALTETEAGGALRAVTEDEYVVDATAGLVARRIGCWLPGRGALRVQYTAGYTHETCPGGLRAALCRLVAWVIEQRGNAGVRHESADGQSLAYEVMDGAVPADVGAMLAAYRRPGMG